MSKINVTELRAHLPDFLSKVSAGEELLVTLRGQVIARIVPPLETKALALQQLKALRKKCRVGDVTSPINAPWQVLDDCP